MGKYQNPLNIGSLGHCLDAIRASGFRVVDLREFDFIDAYATMVLVLAVRYICTKGRVPDIVLPTSENVRSYMARQLFFKTIAHWYQIPAELRQLEDRQWADNPRVAPLTLIHDEDCVSPVANRVRDLLTTADFRVPAAIADEIWNMLSEVLQNVPQHASLGLDHLEPGIAVLQLYPRTLDVAVGDIGVGLTQSLQENPLCRGRSDAELQAIALTMGISRTAERHRGNGLYQVAAKVKQLQGMLRIQSGSSATYYGKMGCRSRPCSMFPGTQIWISIPCRT